MKVLPVIILAAFLAVSASFVVTSQSNSARPRSKGTAAFALPKELVNVDFTKLYNLESSEFNRAEALKAGVKLTLLNRQVKVEYEEKQEQVSDQINEFKEQIKGLENRKKYIALAYECMTSYTTSGKLKVVESGKKYPQTLFIERQCP